MTVNIRLDAYFHQQRSDWIGQSLQWRISLHHRQGRIRLGCHSRSYRWTRRHVLGSVSQQSSIVSLVQRLFSSRDHTTSVIFEFRNLWRWYSKRSSSTERRQFFGEQCRIPIHWSVHFSTPSNMMNSFTRILGYLDFDVSICHIPDGSIIGFQYGASGYSTAQLFRFDSSMAPTMKRN